MDAQQIQMPSDGMAGKTVWRGAAACAAAAVVVGLIVLLCSLFGILTRPLGFLAAFWPANAVLLGVMVRWPGLANPGGWLGAAAGYVAADLVTGGNLLLTLWLSAGNLSGAFAGYLLLSRAGQDHRTLRRPASVLYLFAVCIACAMVATLVGAGVAPAFYGQSLARGMAYWFCTELVNAVIVLPVVLTAPPLAALRPVLRRSISPAAVLAKAVPLVALLASIGAAVLVDGAGAIAFPVPALLWCALSYGLFSTALLTMLVGVWSLAFTVTDATPDLNAFIVSILSVRLGITMLALGPLTAASINLARNDLLRKLDHAASHDFLTGALARGALLERGRALLEASRSRACAVLMLDIDHFKQVNDRHGHGAGDQVLAAVAAAVGKALREGDLFGRMGGEEFAVVLPATSASQMGEIAQRLRRVVADLEIATGEGASLRVTVSIGAATAQRGELSLDALLVRADRALYAAKAAGRDRVAVASPTGIEPVISP